MYTLILWLCATTAVVVFGVMIYSIATFPASAGSAPATFRHRTLVEILWAVIPIVIILAMAAPAVKTLW
jgi:cytochrome c oxidase subunit II